MSLDLALKNSISGLQVQQKSLAIISENIVRSGEKNFSRLNAEIKYNGIGGAKVDSISRQVDELIEKELQAQVSNSSYYSTKNRLLEKINKLFGIPNLQSNNYNTENFSNIPSTLNNFFSAINMLSTIPESHTQKDAVLYEAENLCRSFSHINQELQNLTLAIDQELLQSTQHINQLLSDLYKTNEQMLLKKEYSECYANLEIEQSQILSNLSEYFTISTCFTKEGLKLITSNANVIFNQKPYIFSYEENPEGKIDKAMRIYANKDSRGIVLDKISNSSNSSKGKIKALLEIRNTEIPRIIETLENFLDSFCYEINELYSTGNNFPGTKNLTSKQTFYNENETCNFNGKIRISLLDGNGKNAKDYNGKYIKSLTINMNNVSNISDLINEINQYYNYSSHIAEIEDLYNIQLLSREYQDHKLIFDIEADNQGNEIKNISIDKIKLSYFNLNNNEEIEILNSYDSTDKTWSLNPGERSSSTIGSAITLNGIPEDINEFTVTLNMRINNNNYSISYKLNKNLIEKNQRHSAFYVSGENSKIIINKEPIKQKYVLASLINNNDDINHNTANTLKFLNIKANSDDFYLAIANIDSNEINNYKKNFIHSMGFNNFFEKTRKKNVPIDINENIKKNIQYLNTGYIKEVNPNIFEFGIGNNDMLIEMYNLTNKNIKFPQSANLAEINNTFISYISEIIEYSSTHYYNTKNQDESETKFKELLEENKQLASGVNIDEEISKSIIIQNSYNASAHIISVVQELFKIFIESI